MLIINPQRARVTRGLLGWWPINDGAGSSTIRDMSGNNRDASLVGYAATNWTTDAFGRSAHAIDLGTGIYVNLSSYVTTFRSLNLGTFCIWAKVINTTGAVVRMFNIGEAAVAINTSFAVGKGTLSSLMTNESMLHAILSTGGTWQFGMYSANGEGYYADSTWHHFATVCDGINNTLYVDGVAVTVSFSAGNAGTDLFLSQSAADSFIIGGLRQNNTNYYSVSAAISDARVYNVGLTAGEVNAIAKGLG